MSQSNSEFSRRKFMAASLGALASAGLAGAGPVIAQTEKATDKKKKEGVLLHRTLGRTGVSLPIVSMGAGAANDPGLVQACYEAGMRHIDTAAVYAYGRNEQMVGNAVTKMGVRDKVNIATKVHTPRQREGITPEQSKKKMYEEVEACLRRLKTDYIDILYIHDVRAPDVPKDAAIIEAATKLKEQGKTRAIGISTHSDMANVINAAVEAKVWDVVLTSINFTMANNTALLGAIKNAADNGVGVIAMKTQAGGAQFPNPETLKKYDRAVINSAALKWALNNENITTAITGIGNYEHLRDNFIVAGGLDYTDEEKKFLGDNSIKLSFGFCQQCRSCVPTCPHNAEIPDLMRTHMYAAQYANFGLSRQTIDGIATKRGLDACASCATCSATCANTVDIHRRIDELKLMYA